MKNRRFVLVLILTILGTAVFAGARANWLVPAVWHKVSSGPDAGAVPVESSKAAVNSMTDAPTGTQSPAISQHVIYGLLFREMAAFKRKAEELKSRGQDSSLLENFHKKRAKLNDLQGTALDKVAADCQKEVDDIENQAKEIIDNDRARHPGGRLQKGESLPNSPPKLKELERRRTAAIMNAREKLHGAFGDAEFQRFDEFEQQDVTARAKPVSRPNRPIRTPGSNLNFTKP